jgi:predicted transcriptional regulator
MQSKYNNLKILLKNKGIMIKDLAKMIGMTPANLHKKLKGDVKFLDKDINAILKILDLPYEEVFKENVSVDAFIKVAIDGKSFLVNETTASSIEKFITNGQFRHSEKEVI